MGKQKAEQRRGGVPEDLQLAPVQLRGVEALERLERQLRQAAEGIEERAEAVVEERVAQLGVRIGRMEERLERAAGRMEDAAQQLQGQCLPRAPIRVVLDHVIVSTLRAMQQAHKIAENKKLTAAGEELLVRNLALELNCLYSMEMLLKSRIVRERVLSGAIELPAAGMASNTGKVRFLGGHPRQGEVMLAGQLRDKAYASGMAATLPREEWDTPYALLDADGKGRKAQKK